MNNSYCETNLAKWPAIILIYGYKRPCLKIKKLGQDILDALNFSILRDSQVVWAPASVLSIKCLSVWIFTLKVVPHDEGEVVVIETR